MAMDSVIAHEEPFGDRLIIQAFGDQAQDLNSRRATHRS